MGLYERLQINESGIGRRFGRWTQIGPEFSCPINGTKRRRRKQAVCQCECGSMHSVLLQSLLGGASSRCNVCRKADLYHATHRMSRTPEYQVWRNMVFRCTDQRYRFFHRYGGRGIRVCDAWARSFEAFIENVGKRPSTKHQLDRIDNDGNYQPGNVRWVVPKENVRNREMTVSVVFRGHKITVAKLSEMIGMRYDVLFNRIHRYGWSVEDAATTPVGPRGRKRAELDG